MNESPNNDEIHSFRLVFKRKPRNEKTLTIKIRFHKKGNGLEGTLPFPENIFEEELLWFKYRRMSIAVYHRQNNSNGNRIYTNAQNCIAPTYLTQRFERILWETLQHYKTN